MGELSQTGSHPKVSKVQRTAPERLGTGRYKRLSRGARAVLIKGLGMATSPGYPTDK